jgi:hypothetical protein
MVNIQSFISTLEIFFITAAPTLMAALFPINTHKILDTFQYWIEYIRHYGCQ